MRRSLKCIFFKISHDIERKRRLEKNDDHVKPRKVPPSNIHKPRKKLFSVQIPREDPDSAYATDETGNASVTADDLVHLGKQMGIDYPKSSREREMAQVKSKKDSTRKIFDDTRDFHKVLSNASITQHKKKSLIDEIGTKLEKDGIISNLFEFLHTMKQIGTVFIAVSPQFPVFIQRTIIAQLMSSGLSFQVVTSVAKIAFVVAMDGQSENYHEERFIKWMQRNIIIGTIFLTDICSLLAWEAVHIFANRQLGTELRQCNVYDASNDTKDPVSLSHGHTEESYHDAVRNFEKELCTTRTLWLDLSNFGHNVLMAPHNGKYASNDADDTVKMRTCAKMHAISRQFANSATASFAVAQPKRVEQITPKAELKNRILVDIVLCAPRTTNSGVRENFSLEDLESPLKGKKLRFSSNKEQPKSVRVTNEEVISCLLDKSHESSSSGVACLRGHLTFLRESLENAVLSAGEFASRRPECQETAGCSVVYITASLFQEENERVVGSLFKGGEVDDRGYTLWRGYRIRRMKIPEHESRPGLKKSPKFIKESPLLSSTYRAFPDLSTADGAFLAVIQVLPKSYSSSADRQSVNFPKQSGEFHSFFGFHTNQLNYLSCGTFSPTILLETATAVIAKSNPLLDVSEQPTQVFPGKIGALKVTSGLKILDKVDFIFHISDLHEFDKNASRVLKYKCFMATTSFACHRYLSPLWECYYWSKSEQVKNRRIHFLCLEDILLLLYIGEFPSEIIAHMGNRICGWESCMYNHSSTKDDVQVGSRSEKDVVYEKGNVLPSDSMHIMPGAVMVSTKIDLRRFPLVNLEEVKAGIVKDAFYYDEEECTLTICLVVNIHYTQAELGDSGIKSLAVRNNRSFEISLPENWRKFTRPRKVQGTTENEAANSHHVETTIKYLVRDPFLVALRDALCFLRTSQGLPYKYEDILSSYSKESQLIIHHVAREASLKETVTDPNASTQQSALESRSNESKEWEQENLDDEAYYHQIQQSGVEFIEESVVSPDWK